jgi:hypothetical protein
MAKFTHNAQTALPQGRYLGRKRMRTFPQHHYGIWPLDASAKNNTKLTT